MVPSAVINEAIVFITAAAMVVLVRRVSREKLKESFRYFTVLSNVFCAFTALILLLSELFGAMPAWAVALKYMGTVADGDVFDGVPVPAARHEEHPGAVFQRDGDRHAPGHAPPRHFFLPLLRGQGPQRLGHPPGGPARAPLRVAVSAAGGPPKGLAGLLRLRPRRQMEAQLFPHDGGHGDRSRAPLGPVKRV